MKCAYPYVFVIAQGSYEMGRRKKSIIIIIKMAILAAFSLPRLGLFSAWNIFLFLRAFFFTSACTQSVPVSRCAEIRKMEELKAR